MAAFFIGMQLTSGDFLPASAVAEFERDGICGHCRGSLGRSIYTHGLEVLCPHCGEELWFEVTANQVIQHPGRKRDEQQTPVPTNRYGRAGAPR